MKSLRPILPLLLSVVAATAQTNRTLTYNITNNTVTWSSTSPLVVPALAWSNAASALDTRTNLGAAAASDPDGTAQRADYAEQAGELFDVANGDFSLRIFDSETTWGSDITRLNFRASLGFSGDLDVIWTATNTASLRTSLGFSTNLTGLWTAPDAASARSTLGLGPTNDVEFARVQLGGVVLTTNGLTGALTLTGSQAITWSSGGSPAATRTNLGLPWSGLTNTNAANIRTALGVGTNDSVQFGSMLISNGVTVNQAESGVGIGFGWTGTTNRVVIAGTAPAGIRLISPGYSLSFGTNNTDGPAITRTNLGLGATNTPEFRSIVLDGATADSNKATLITVDPTGANVFRLPNTPGTNTILTSGNPAAWTTEVIRTFGYIDHVNMAMATRATAAGGLADLRFSDIFLRAVTNAGSYGWAKLGSNLQRNSSSSGQPFQWSTPFILVTKLAAFGYDPTHLVGLQLGRSTSEVAPGWATNKAVGFRWASPTSMELFAHNGTNLVTAPFTANHNHMDFLTFVLENQGNGTVRLYRSDGPANTAGALPHVLVATLTNGPIGSSPDYLSSMWEVFAATGTNTAPFNATVVLRSAAMIHTNYTP